jgi:hypothetical protein
MAAAPVKHSHHSIISFAIIAQHFGQSILHHDVPVLLQHPQACQHGLPKHKGNRKLDAFGNYLGSSQGAASDASRCYYEHLKSTL